MRKKSTLQRICRYLSTIVLMVLFAGNLQAQEWTIYDGSTHPIENGLPQFSRSNVSGVTNEVFDSWSTIIVDPEDGSNFLLQFNDDAAAQRGMWRSNIPSGTSKLTLVTKIKAFDYENLDWTLDIDIDFGGAREQFFIMNSDQIRVRRGTDVTHDLPTEFDLTEWNTFRFVIDNDAEPKTVKVYLNESATPFIEATPASGSNNYFRFGNGDSNRSVGYTMDWIIWDITGAYAPGEGAAIPDPVVTPSWNADLAELNVDGSLIEGFSASTLNYEVVLPKGTTIVPTVTAVSDDSEANVDITPATEIPGTTEVQVTAENGISTKTYSILFREVSEDATLTSISVNGDPIADFDPETLSYTVYLPLETTEQAAEVTATATHKNAVVDITQATEIDGEATILVTAEDGTTELTYTVNFELISVDATLSDLLIDGVTVDGFDPEELEYFVLLPAEAITPPTVTAVLNTELASMEITQAADIPGEATVVVTAEDGVTENTYSVTFLQGDDDATLSDLMLDGVTIGGFDPEVTEYEVIIPTGETDIPVVTAEANHENATVAIVEATEIPGVTTVTVTAEDSFTELVYSVAFRYKSDNTKLEELHINGAPLIGFDPEVTSYTINMPINSIVVPEVTAAAADALATVDITPAAEIPGQTLILVTAEDEVTELTYTIEFVEADYNWRYYDASLLPDAQEPKFSTSNVNGTAHSNTIITDDEDESNSFLELITETVGTTFMWSTPLQAETPAVTFVFKVKAANDEARRVLEFDIHHNGIRERMYINREDNRVRLNEGIGGGDGGEIVAPEGVSFSDWNIYRITKEEGSINLYLNENPEPIATGTTATTTTNQYFRFGGGNSSHNIAALIDWIVWDETGAYAPGEGLFIPSKVETTNWDATLAELKLDDELIEGFDPEVTEYQVLYTEEPTTIPVVSAVANNEDAIIDIIQATTTLPDTAFVEVTALNGFTTITYSVIFRLVSTDATLENLIIDGIPVDDFDPEVLAYDIELPYGTVTIPTVTAVATDENAEVEIAQADALPGTATVTVTAEDGETTLEYVVNFTIATSVGITENQKFNVYPNPATSYINVSVDDITPGAYVKIIGISGKVLMQMQLNSTKEVIDISNLTQGTYIIQIETQGKRDRKLFIKQ